ncbi:MAG: hypothetical protein MN733_35695, partial [Nitrososphaera sp.]|nr:hypothetical protein [Nitrososphaera sp.]
MKKQITLAILAILVLLGLGWFVVTGKGGGSPTSEVATTTIEYPEEPVPVSLDTSTWIEFDSENYFPYNKLSFKYPSEWFLQGNALIDNEAGSSGVFYEVAQKGNETIDRSDPLGAISVTQNSPLVFYFGIYNSVYESKFIKNIVSKEEIDSRAFGPSTVATKYKVTGQFRHFGQTGQTGYEGYVLEILDTDKK